MRLLSILLLVAAAQAQVLPNAVPMPTPEIQYFGADGLPLIGGKLCTYVANSNTPLATYTDSTAGTPNSNPVVLDTAGRASVWVGPQLYKFVLRSGGDATCSTGTIQWTQDNVADTTLYFVNYVKTAGSSTLITYTAPFSGAVQRTVAARLSDRVSIKDFGAVGDGSTDNTAAINASFASNRGVFVPCGTFLITNSITLQDLTNVSWFGDGPCSIIKLDNAWPNARDVVKLLGSSQVDIHGLHFDGLGATPVDNTVLYGDGSVANASYGPVSIHNNLFTNLTSQVVGVGANFGNTASDISIVDNVFSNVGYGSKAMHPIDTGSGGTKNRYTISRNKVIYGSQTPGGDGNCIFAGHGTNHDFVISNNHLSNCSARGILVFDRPWTNEATALQNFVVAGNTIDTPQWDGIGIFGGDGVVVSNNTIRNVGQGDPFGRGILVTHGITGPSTNESATNINIVGNTIIDTQMSSTLVYGIAFDGAAMVPSYATVLGNTIAGYTTTPYYFLNSDNSTVSILSTWNNGKTALNMSVPTTTNGPLGTFDVFGDTFARINQGDPNIFMSTLTSTETTDADFAVGVGFNARWDQAALRWKSQGDAVSNGMAAILARQGDGTLRFFAAGTTGGTNQSITQAAMKAQEWWNMDYRGYLQSMGRTFAQITAASPADGAMVWCSNCTIASPCSGAGTGAWAFKSHTIWKCPF